MATPGVGQDIEDHCGRCGDTWHVVMAKLGDRVVKVVCKRCGGQHNYRNESASGAGPRGKSAPRRSTRRASAGPPELTPPPVTDPNKPPRVYSARDSYLAGERIAHPSFGTGVVRGSPGAGKVDVVFPSGLRVLACAKVASALERPAHVELAHAADRPPDKA